MLFLYLKRRLNKHKSINEMFNEELERAIKQIKSWTRCTSQLLLASSRFENSSFTCEVTAKHNVLLSWLAKYHDKEYYSDSYVQGSRRVLLLWLAAANEHDTNLTIIPPELTDFFEEHLPELVKTGLVDVHCPKCDKHIKEVQIQEIDLIEPEFDCMTLGWTDLWTCDNNHILYKKVHKPSEIHVCLPIPPEMINKN